MAFLKPNFKVIYYNYYNYLIVYSVIVLIYFIFSSLLLFRNYRVCHLTVKDNNTFVT